ncbi:MAG: hypothetical protein ABEJ80_05070 [Halarchaeum sp.]
MAQGRLTERAKRTERTDRAARPPDACPGCGGALDTRDVLEHLPCGRVHFADDEERTPCPKCGDPPAASDVAHRGTVRVCPDCGYTEDATGRAGATSER